jgi:glycosyltransferase involved in cell wall biosynthesis
MLLLAALTTLVLTAAFVDFALGQRRLRSLETITPAQTGPTVSIVAPARNEARGIEAAVRSLVALDYPNLEAVVVNDRSTDETGTILKRIADEIRSAPKTTTTTLTVIDVAELPEGWLGKNHAMAVGAARARGDLILFTDADVVFRPDTLRRAVALMEREKIDHLAALPDVRVKGIALNAFVAAFSVFFSMYARPWKARDPRSRAHIGIGAFNLIRASVYRAIGTHRAIAMRPDDDIKLGKLVKKHGFRQDAVFGHGFIRVEWYASLRELVDGLMKNAFAGVGYSVLAVAISTAALLLIHTWPFVAVFVTNGATQGLYAASVLLIVLIFWTINGSRVPYVLFYPAAALMFAYVMWRSALLAVGRGAVEWRGTRYPLAAMKANRV